jgi:glutamate synthase domain-containing protein 1
MKFNLFTFKKTLGGNENWYTKSKDWARNQKYPLNQIAKAVIEWLWQQWVEAKVEQEMEKVDQQVEEIQKKWDEEIPDPWETVYKSTPSEVEGLDNISISWRPRESDTKTPE